MTIRSPMAKAMGYVQISLREIFLDARIFYLIIWELVVAVCNQAIGWLAREDKIALQKKGRSIIVNLV